MRRKITRFDWKKDKDLIKNIQEELEREKKNEQ